MLAGPPAMVGLFYGGDMGKYDKIDVGEKLPGTYCPICGEIGLRKMVFDNVVWAVCPMIAGEPIVKKLKDAHTGYIISAKTSKTKPKPKPETAINLDELTEGVEDA